MRTPDLIDNLVGELEPIPPGFFARRLGLALGAGGLLALAIVLSAWGLRPDMAIAPTTLAFWIKSAFTVSLAAGALYAVVRLSYPDVTPGRGAWLALAVPPVIMAALAGAQLAIADAAAYPRLVMGSTAAACPWLIAALAMPILGGLMMAMRAMAPVHLRCAGAVAGLTAGAFAASIYALACDESAMPFLLIWYGLGMLIPAIVGAAIARPILRW